MYLYIKSHLSLEETGHTIGVTALPDHDRQLRDGLNLGGGEYFKFHTVESEVFLVCNDVDHLEVFVEGHASFPFYCYAKRGSNNVLEKMLSLLRSAGIECELADENA